MTFERLDSHRAIVGDGFEVRRALPNRHRRMIGAWCFLDHAGPADFPAGGGLMIGPHPHIGLQTFTWVIEGKILHRDSLGFEQWISPGQVNLMTAGRGVAHSEDSPADTAGRFQLAQLWIALPRDECNREPSFHHYPELPLLDRGGFRITVLAGAFAGERSPAEVHSPLIGLELVAQGSARAELPLDRQFEHAAVTLEGAPDVGGESLAPSALLYLGTGRASLPVASAQASRLLVIGGRPFGEEILLWWNFVARTQGEMEVATRDWREGRRFGQVHGARSAPLVAPDVGALRAAGASR
jgi:redox-sensitive bicupin YhaK (pirin superfamily)